MTVRECVDKWVEMSDEDRTKWGSILMDSLTPISMQELTAFQGGWDEVVEQHPEWANDTAAGYLEFKTAQQGILQHCLAMEASVIGSMVRKAVGKAPLNPDEPMVESSVIAPFEENHA